MKRNLTLAILSLCLLFSQLTNGQVINHHFVDGEVFLKVRNSSNVSLAPYDHTDIALNLMYTQFGIDTIIRCFPDLDSTMDRVYRVKFHNHNLADTMVTAMSALSFVEYCEKAPIFTCNTAFTPNDLNAAQYHLLKIFAPDAWGVSQGSTNIIVAIVDNGVRTSHSDLAGHMWTNPNPGSVVSQYPNDVHGYDVADNDNNPNPPTYARNNGAYSHGTHCAGIAGAITNNGNGIASIGFNVSIMPVKCAPDNSLDSGAALTNAYDGVYYAIQKGANIISMSWGGSDGTFLTGQNLINSGYAKGIVMVAAAGNESQNTPFYPAAFDHVIAVGATGQTDAKASYSNYGSYLDVMAPGTNIYSTEAGDDNGYGNISGTSMACPLVAGLAALVKANYPSFSADQITQQIKTTCDNIDVLNPTFVGQIGAGRINAARALGATPTVGINALEETDRIMYVAPNPSEGHFSLYWGGIEPLEQISVSDYTGREVMHQNNLVFTGHKVDIDLSSSLPTGMYFLKGQSAGKAYVFRFIVL